MLHSFIEAKNLRWEFLQQGVFPAPLQMKAVCTKWHQPFCFEDSKLEYLLFHADPCYMHKGLPEDLSLDLKEVYHQYSGLKEVGYLSVSELWSMALDTDEFRPDSMAKGLAEGSLFWRDLQILKRFGMGHRIRILVWTT
jgi:hypothetical protein